MEKRPYTPPKIVRVELTPEQAVLSQCSAMASTIDDVDPVFCNSGIFDDRDRCREMEVGMEGNDSAASS